MTTINESLVVVVSGWVGDSFSETLFPKKFKISVSHVFLIIMNTCLQFLVLNGVINAWDMVCVHIVYRID